MAKKILKFTMTGNEAPDYIEKTFFQDVRLLDQNTRPAIGLSVDNPSNNGDGELTSIADIETYLQTLMPADETQPGNPLGDAPNTPVPFNWNQAAKKIWYTIHPEENTDNICTY